MPKTISFGELHFKVVASMNEMRSKLEPEIPFRICILGGPQPRKPRYLRTRFCADGTPPDHVGQGQYCGCDEKDGVEVRLPVPGTTTPPVVIRFTELDDFHPNNLSMKPICGGTQPSPVLSCWPRPSAERDGTFGTARSRI